MRENFGPRPIRLQAKDVTIVRAGVDAILAVDGDVFRREAIDAQPFDLRELVVLRICAREFRRRRWIPCDGIDWNRPEEKITD